MMQTAHLTDEQFADLLAGSPAAAAQAHIATCAQCSRQAGLISTAMGDFAEQSRLWAERRAAALPPASPEGLHPSGSLAAPRFAAVAALLVAMAAATTIGVHQVHHLAAGTGPAPQSASTLKSDNDLLSAIDGELRADASTQASTYHLETSRRSDGGRSKRAIGQ